MEAINLYLGGVGEQRRYKACARRHNVMEGCLISCKLIFLFSSFFIIVVCWQMRLLALSAVELYMCCSWGRIKCSSS